MKGPVKKGMGGHQSRRAVTTEWLTPPDILKSLGPFDLDPCAPVTSPWRIAAKHYTRLDDGLAKEWFGRVWLNPPYGRETHRWLARLADHGNGIALIFARTETCQFFDYVWPTASAVMFLKGRLHFHRPDGRRAPRNAGAPSVLVAYGRNNVAALQSCRLPGKFITLRSKE